MWSRPKLAARTVYMLCYTMSCVHYALQKYINTNFILGGCKHCVAFVLWLHRRSEEPSVTSVKCYWQGSKLSKADTIDVDFLTILGRPVTFEEPDLQFVRNVVSALPTKDSVICQFFEEPQDQGTIHNLWTNFIASGIDITPPNFYAYAESTLDQSLIEKIEKATQKQAEEEFWHKMRFGRITASIIYDAAKSKTFQGSLQEKILGAQIALTTKAVERGKKLEPEVLEVVANIKSMTVKKAGLFLRKDYPIFGASPDGISSDFVLEVKCPSTEKHVKTYIKDGIVARKFYFQVQLQMMFAGKRKGLFCVASPQFETNKMVDIIEVDYNEDKLMNILNNAKQFWEMSIFRQLVNSYCS